MKCTVAFKQVQCTAWPAKLFQVRRRLNTKMFQVASGMAHLHSRRPSPVLHGDLKTANLLVDNDSSSLVIADFGLSGWLADGGPPASQAAVAGWLTVTIAPPEVSGVPWWDSMDAQLVHSSTSP
jgi:serine/threonine protein kinase